MTCIGVTHLSKSLVFPLIHVQLKQKEEKEHELMQKERSKSHLEQAKQASIERLVRATIMSYKDERRHL